MWSSRPIRSIDERVIREPVAMATFYLLPPRACLNQALCDLFARLLPGLPLPGEAWELVTNCLGSAAGWPPDVFLVPRDDLPDGDPVPDALACAFGAEPGDHVVEVSLAHGADATRIGVLAPGNMSALAAAR